MTRHVTTRQWITMLGASTLALTLVACGGSASTDSSSSEPAPSSTAASSSPAPEPSSSDTATTEPAEEYATVEQYASVVSEARRDMEEQIGIIEECALGYSAGDLECALSPLTFRFQADTLNIRMSQDAKDDIRLLPPPPEIADLVARTLEVTAEIEALSEAVEKCDEYKGCESEWIALSMGASKVQDILDAWQPYI